jgi:hypothetical protein
MLCVREVRGGGVEGKHKGRKAVGFERGTRVNGTFATMKEGLPSQVSGFLFLMDRENALSFQICVYMQIKRTLCAG